jgi:hypothetical protein
MTAADQRGEILDVLGVGFGPSNLALAIALEEQAGRATATRPVRAGFIERQGQFGWHRGMLITGATMQVSFLKDLVTMRNPTSDFSFIAYLHEPDVNRECRSHVNLVTLPGAETLGRRRPGLRDLMEPPETRTRPNPPLGPTPPRLRDPPPETRTRPSPRPA